LKEINQQGHCIPVPLRNYLCSNLNDAKAWAMRYNPRWIIKIAEGMNSCFRLKSVYKFVYRRASPKLHSHKPIDRCERKWIIGCSDSLFVDNSAYMRGGPRQNV